MAAAPFEVLLPEEEPPADDEVSDLPPLSPEEEAELQRRLAEARVKLSGRIPMGAKTALRREIKEILAQLRGGVDERALATWMRQRVKWGKGKTNGVFAAGFRALPGWTVRETTMLVPVRDSDVLLTREERRQFSDAGTFLTDRSDAIYVVGGRGSKGPFTELVDLIKARLHEGKPPEEPEVGSIYVPNLTERSSLEIANHFEFHFPLLRPVHLGVDALHITAPDGKDAWVPEPENEHRSRDSFWSWAYEHGLATSAAEVLPGIEAKVPKARSTKDSRSTGTCPVCFRNLGFQGIRIAHHGFRFPDHRFRMGASCPGTGFLPWEESASGTQAFVVLLLQRVQNCINGFRTLLRDKWALTALFKGTYEQYLAFIEAENLPPDDQIKAPNRWTKVRARLHIPATSRLWPNLAKRFVQSYLEQARRLYSTDLMSIAWYRAAISDWKPGNRSLPKPHPTLDLVPEREDPTTLADLFYGWAYCEGGDVWRAVDESGDQLIHLLPLGAPPEEAEPEAEADEPPAPAPPPPANNANNANARKGRITFPPAKTPYGSKTTPAEYNAPDRWLLRNLFAIEHTGKEMDLGAEALLVDHGLARPDSSKTEPHALTKAGRAEMKRLMDPGGTLIVSVTFDYANKSLEAATWISERLLPNDTLGGYDEARFRVMDANQLALGMYEHINRGPDAILFDMLRDRIGRAQKLTGMQP